MTGLETDLFTWCATLAWRGDRYAGWQIQPDNITIQDTVQRAVGKLCGLDHPVAVSATGRTDAGVHAEMQIIGFQIPVERTAKQVAAGINFHTPDDIVCLDAKPMPSDFWPRGWTQSKVYRYRILNRAASCPFRSGVVWHIKQPLDAEAMASAMEALVGTHDFSSFRAAGCSAQSPVRTVQDSRFVHAGDGELQLEFEGHGFLRHQVRIMVGTLVDVGLGKRPCTDVRRVRDAIDRSCAGPTAPAHGLTLVRVVLGDGPRS